MSINFKTLALGAVLILGMTACNDDNDGPDKPVTINYPTLPGIDGITAVTPIVGGVADEFTTLPGCTINATINVRSGATGVNTLAMNMSVIGLNYAPGKIISFDVPEQVALADSDGSLTIKATNLTVKATDGKLYEFHNFCFYSVMYQGFVLTWSLSGEIDGYFFNVFRKVNTFCGKSLTTNGTGDSFTTSTPYYVVTVADDGKTASVKGYNVAYAAAMPVQKEMFFNNIPVEMTRDGYKLEAESVVPVIGGTPFPAFTLSDFSAQMLYYDGLSMNFNVGNLGHVAFHGFYTPVEAQEK